MMAETKGRFDMLRQDALYDQAKAALDHSEEQLAILQSGRVTHHADVFDKTDITHLSIADHERIVEAATAVLVPYQVS
jgi:hypothetical protein